MNQTANGTCTLEVVHSWGGDRQLQIGLEIRVSVMWRRAVDISLHAALKLCQEGVLQALK